MLEKILGLIDLASAIAFLMLIFGIPIYIQFLLFCAGLLFLKSMFIFTGDVLSWLDMLSSIILVLAIFFSLPSLFLWVPGFLLLAKAFVSFL